MITGLHLQERRSPFIGTQVAVYRNAGWGLQERREAFLTGFDTIGTFDIGLLNYI